MVTRVTWLLFGPFQMTPTASKKIFTPGNSTSKRCKLPSPQHTIFSWLTVHISYTKCFFKIIYVIVIINFRRSVYYAKCGWGSIQFYRNPKLLDTVRRSKSRHSYNNKWKCNEPVSKNCYSNVPRSCTSDLFEYFLTIVDYYYFLPATSKCY